MNYVQYESENNDFLRAVQKGGAAHAALVACRPFDALLVPIQAAIDALASELGNPITFNDVFVKSHVVRLEHHYGTSFTTAAGVKGSFGDQLEAIQLQGHPSITILRHVVPSAACTPQEVEVLDPQSLNYFLVSDVVRPTNGPLSRLPGATGKSTLGLSEIMDGPQEVEEEKSLQQQRHRRDGYALVPAGSPKECDDGSGVPPHTSSWGSWIVGIGRTARQQAASVLKVGPRGETQVEAQERRKDSKFREFQEKMGKPESQPIVVAIKNFIAEVESEMQPAQSPVAVSGKRSPMPPPSPNSTSIQSGFVDPEVIHGFIEDILEEMKEIPIWDAADGPGSDGYESARDCLEKYLMTKLFRLCFCRTEEELVENSKLEQRISAFGSAGAVTPQQLDAIDLTASTHHKKAVEMLRKLNQYKNPQDKIECIAKCFDHLLTALENVSKPADASDGITPASSQEQEQGAYGADHILPCFMMTILIANPSSLLSNAKFIDRYRHPSRMQGEGGYYATTLLSVAMFWLRCTAADLRMPEEEFERLLRNERRSASTSNGAKGPSTRQATSPVAMPADRTPTTSPGGSTAQEADNPNQKAVSRAATIFDQIFGKETKTEDQTSAAPSATVAQPVSATSTPPPPATMEAQQGKDDLTVALEEPVEWEPGPSVVSSGSLTIADVEGLWSEYRRLRRIEAAVRSTRSSSSSSSCPE